MLSQLARDRHYREERDSRVLEEPFLTRLEEGFESFEKESCPRLGESYDHKVQVSMKRFFADRPLFFLLFVLGTPNFMFFYALFGSSLPARDNVIRKLINWNTR